VYWVLDLHNSVLVVTFEEYDLEHVLTFVVFDLDLGPTFDLRLVH